MRMKQFLLPISLMIFAVVCLGIVHVDNVDKLDLESNKLREKYERKITKEDQKDSVAISIPNIK